MAQLPIEEKDYSDGRTKQAFKDQADINKIIARVQVGETISHLAKYGATYGDFSDVDDLLQAHERLKAGRRIFDELPSEIRREFENDIGRFFNFVNNPANVDKLPEILPDLAKPGSQLPAIRRTPQNVDATAPTEPDAGPPPENPPQPA